MISRYAFRAATLAACLLATACVDGTAFTAPEPCQTVHVADTSQATPRSDTLTLTVCVHLRGSLATTVRRTTP